MRFFRVIIFLVSVTLLSVPIGFSVEAGQPADVLFDKGTKAFGEGNYEQALAFFEAANRSGMDTPALNYNLGVAYFKLERYEKARRVFEKLTQASDTAALAHYNLGLIGLQADDRQAARQHFQEALGITDNAKLRRLANNQLKRLAPRKEARVWSGYFSLAGGYDDNVALEADSQVLGDMVGDGFWELIASGTGQLLGTNDNGLKLKTMGYYLDYLEEDQFDFGNFRLGPEVNRQIGAWDTSLGGFVDLALIDKSLFERIYSGRIRGERDILNNLAWRLEYQFSRIDAQDPYSDLTGNRHRVGTELKSFILGTYVRAGYTYEANDRDDEDYPTRHRVRFIADRDLTEAWRAGFSGSYRYSDYQQTEQEDDRIWLSFRLSRRIPWEFRIFGKYDYIRNDSNIPEEEYTSNIFSIGIERIF